MPILPSKRARKIPEKIQVSKDDLDELQNKGETSAPESLETDTENADEEASLDEMKEEEVQANEQEDTEATKS